MTNSSTTTSISSDTNNTNTNKNDNTSDDVDDTLFNNSKNGVIKESVIRKMTRLAGEYGAINLSQGFPNESPPWLLRLSLAHSVLGGQPFDNNSKDNNNDNRLTATTNTTTPSTTALEDSISMMLLLSNNKNRNNNQNDQLNQYSPPCGREDVRVSIADYYKRFYHYETLSAEDITVTLGATEALASALRTVGKPGDKCVIFEPFHELYPSQCQLFYLDPVYVTLRPTSLSSSLHDKSSSNSDDNTTRSTIWTYDPQEFETAMAGSKILILNTPHNPTGKVFTKMELTHIVSLCRKYDVYLITDDIYEHMCYGTRNSGQQQHRHIVIPQEFPEMVDRTLVCNSIGKSASATGWRVGWCLHPPHLRHAYRGIHDQLVVMTPHPMQYATLSYFTLPDAYFVELATKYEHRVHKLSTALLAVGFQVIVPQGAYYLFVNYRSVPQLSEMTSMEAAMYLLTIVGVACVPGDNFYGNQLEETTNTYLRFAACRSDEDLEEAIRLLNEKLLLTTTQSK